MLDPWGMDGDIMGTPNHPTMFAFAALGKLWGYTMFMIFVHEGNEDNCSFRVLAQDDID